MNRCALILILICFGATVSVEAQETALHPLMDGTIRSDFAEGARIIFIRTALNIDVDDEIVSGRSQINAVPGDASSPTDKIQNVFLMVQDLDVQSVWSGSDSLSWSVSGGILTTVLDFSTVPELTIEIRFSVRSALRRRHRGQSPSALWSSSAPGQSGWRPTPLDEMDPYDALTSISAPARWKVKTSSALHRGMFSDTDRVYSSSQTTGRFAHHSGFFAYDSTEVLLFDEEDLNSLVPTIASDSLKNQMFSFVTYHLEERIGIEIEPPSEVFIVPGALSIESFDQLAVIPQYDMRGPDSWIEQFNQNRRSIGVLLGPSFSRLVLTDIWIKPALSSWLAIDYLRASQSDAAAGLVLEHLRQAYLKEASEYVRPLVWDRWENASDLLDTHAFAKGAWVMRMLKERLGERAFLAGIKQFFATPEGELMDSETLRRSFESVSREDLRTFFDVWVYSAGHPELSLSHSFDVASERASVSVSQHQEGQLVPEAFEFDATFQYSSLAETNTITIRLQDRQQSSTFPTSIAPRFVHPDAFAEVLVDFQTPPSRDDLVSQLRYSVDDGSTIRSLNLLAGMDLNPSVLLGLRSSITQNSDPALLHSASEILAKMAPSGSALATLQLWAGHDDSRVKSSALRSIAAFEGNASAFSTALDAANTGRDGRVLSASVTALASLRPGNAWAYFKSALVTESENDRVRLDALDLMGPETGPNDEMIENIRGFLDEDPILSSAALKAIWRIDPSHSLAIDTVGEWIGSDLAIQRMTAIQLLGRSESLQLEPDDILGVIAREPYYTLRRQFKALLPAAEREP